MTDILASRRDRLDSQQDVSSYADYRFNLDKLFITETKFVIYSRPLYDTFELGRSILGEERVFTTTDDWNDGTLSNVTVSSGTITGNAGGGTWISPTLYWNDSSTRTTIDNFNTSIFNGEWEEVPDGATSSNDGTFTRTFDGTYEAQGYNYYLASNTASSDKIYFKKEFDTSITLEDKLYILHKGNAIVKFYSGSETAYSEGETTWGGNFTSYDSWNYRKELTITETSGSTLTNHQVKLTIDTKTLIDAGKMEADGDDIRFVNENGTFLNYWIESGINTTTTIIWVEFDSLTASSTNTFYMFYGYPSASSVSSLSSLFGSNTYLYFSLDETSGNVIDYWETNDGIVSGAIRGIAGYRGTGYSFDGIDDYIDLNSSQSTLLNSDFTMAGWFNLNASPTAQILIGNYNNSSGICNVERLSSGTLRLCMNDATSCIDTGVDISGNTGWFYLVITRSKTTPSIKVYINGSLVYSTATNATDNFTSSTGGHLFLGRDARAATTRPYDGKMDEIMFWNREITQSEVEALYASSIPTYSFDSEEEIPAGTPTSYSPGTLEFTATLTGTPTAWTESEFDTSAKDGTSINRVLIEDSGTDYYELNGSDYYRFALDAMWTKDTDRSTTWTSLALTTSDTITVDILKASDDSVLVSGLSGTNINLKTQSDLEGENIKVKLYLDSGETVDDLTVSWKPSLLGNNKGKATTLIEL